MTALLIDLPSVYAGALQQFTISCAGLLASGETIASVTAGVQLWAYSPVQDANATELLRGSASVSGSNVLAWVGGISTSANFQPGAVYSLAAQLTTSLGNTPIAIGNITVSPVTPPSLGSGAALPSTEYAVTSNTTIGAAGIYYLNASGLTLTLPSASVSGEIVIVDQTGAPNASIAGTVLNAPSSPLAMSAGYASLTLVWSAKYSGWVLI